MRPLHEPLHEDASCGLRKAIEAVGERWAFMILRASYNGLSHFEEFQASLGIARNILASRLARLVDQGILSRHAVDSDRRKIDYRLTAKGRDLIIAMVALRQWGERWSLDVPPDPVLCDRRDRRPIQRILALSHDGRALAWEDMEWRRADEMQSG